MLALSAVIATAGVLSDSTATVIGAMIIAPLATPIMSIALGIAKRDSITSRHAMRFVTLGAALVVFVGAAIAISLVPPLAVVGVCLGQGAFALALGAFVLFFSNLLALLLAGRGCDPFGGQHYGRLSGHGVVQTPGDLPPVEEFVADLDGQVPNGFSIIVRTSVGEEIEAGTIGG
jgi:uncharacterized membrane protein